MRPGGRTEGTGYAPLARLAIVATLTACGRGWQHHIGKGTGMALQFGPTGCITLDGTTAATVTEWTADLSGVLPVQPCELGWLLGQIEAHDQDYAARYGMVLGAVAIASTLGYAAGFRIDPDEPGWPVAYIELPTGQVSWHMPQHDRAWDGHTTADKYDRCRAFAASLGGVAPYGPIV